MAKKRYGVHGASKFGNHKVEYKGIKFDSKLELNCYKVLDEWRMNEAQHLEISIRLQVKYILQEKFRDPETNKVIQPITYSPDFVVEAGLPGSSPVTYVIDAKGQPNDRFPLKAKMMLKQHHRVIIVKSKARMEKAVIAISAGKMPHVVQEIIDAK